MKERAAESDGDASSTGPVLAQEGLKTPSELNASVAECRSRGWKMAGIGALLTGLVFLVFWQTVRSGFVYDDTLYVTNDRLVQQGLTIHGIIKSLTYEETDYWHPLTWISHMLDYQLYGLWAGGHHLTNALLHAATVVLLFIVLVQMTGALWRCAFIAAAWAIHPLRAESVAWIAERKDVLSGLFFVLALGAYVHAVRQPSTSRRLLAAVLFALGLMSKNMLITFPCVLLLLDYWPLLRWNQRAQFGGLLKEKIPLFALSAISGVSTFLYRGIADAVGQLPLWNRLQNALVCYAIYLRQSVWPTGLAANYPISNNGYPVWIVAGSLALLCLLTAAAVGLRQKRPYLLVGWLWFVGMLVPVIGLVQIGYFAHADRYTYLPQIGLWMAGTWMVADLAGKWRYRHLMLGVMAAVILCALSDAAWRQVSYWRDGIALWTRALECNPGDPVAHDELGLTLFEQGNLGEAMAHYQEALRLDPDSAKAAYNLGLALEKEGRMTEAIAEYRAAVRAAPNYGEAHNNLGFALFRQGQIEEAIAEYREALQIDPTDAGVYNNLGNALLEQRQTEAALESFRNALQFDPNYAEAHNNLANALVRQGRLEEAAAQYGEALRVKPTYANAHYNLGSVLIREGQGGEAIKQFEEALALQPDNPTYQNVVALLLATAPQTSLRDGSRALALATKASQATGGNNPMILRTLAAAYAEAGQFPDAVTTARKALQLSEAQSNTALAEELRREIQLYEAGRRFENAR